MNSPMKSQNCCKSKLIINLDAVKNIVLKYIFQAFIFLSFLEKYNLVSSFLYSSAITLKNGNIFIIHSSSIDIYDSTLKNKIKTIETFFGNEIISNETYSKIIIKKIISNNSEYLNCVINEKIYIFNSHGEKLYNSDEKITLFQGEKYELRPIKIINNDYYYMLSYINENKNIQLLFGKFEEKSQKNNLLYNNPIIDYIDNNKSFLIKNKLFTCQLMKNNSQTEKIICFYYLQNTLQYSFIDIENYSFNKTNHNIIKLPNGSNQIKEIISFTNFNKSQILICFNSIKGKGYCFTYLINTNSHSKIIEYISNCKSQNFGIKLDYKRETKQYLFSCLDENNYLNLVIFNNNFSYFNNYTINDFSFNYGYSIVYSYSRENYLIISHKQYIEINPFLHKSDESKKEYNKIINSKIDNQLRKLEKTNNSLNFEKCLDYTEESISKELCLSCNTALFYFQINPDYISHNQLFSSQYIDCYNNDTKPKNFFFNSDTNFYEPCYWTCGSCKNGGDGNQNNCTSCAMDYIEEPGNEGSSNCVVSCKHYFYYTSYGQYKCSANPQCPEETSLLIREKKKCVANCSTDNIYKFQYSGECFKICPNETIPDNNSICRVKDEEVCSKSSSEFDLYDFLKEGGVEKIVKTYVDEFAHFDKHISLYINDVYSIMLYKEANCITELKLSMPEIDFGVCYLKVQAKYGIKESLIVAIIDKSSSKKSNPITSYSFYNPRSGEKLDSETACKEEVIVVKENIKSLLNESVQDMDSILFLTEQNINIFNKSSDFYKDLCYHYESQFDKDVALRDRLLIYYPNITLCDSGCTNTGVNLTSMTAICECKFKEMNEEDEEDNSNLYQSAVNEVFNILNQVNLAVLACYKDLFDYKYFISCTGGLMMVFIIFIQFIDCIIYYFISFFSLKKYIYNMTENYLLFLNKSPMYKPHINKLSEEEKKPKKQKKQKKENCPPRKNNDDNNVNIFNINNNNKKQNLKIKKADNKKKVLKTQEGSEDKNNSKLVLCQNKLFNKKNRTKSNSNLNIKVDKSLLSLRPIEKSNTNPLSNTSNVGKNISFFNNYLSTHLNDMLFNDALVQDKRLFFDYFCDKIKRKEIITDIILIDEPIKPKALKFLLLLLDIEVCFVINGMFINEDYVSKLFHSTKKENFISFLPRSINRCVYTIVVNILVSYIVGCFFIEERRLKSIFKYEKNNVYAIKYEIYLVIREMKWRYNIFIIVTVVISIFSWYYISCFNNIYPHMKIEWIKSSVFIFLLVHFITVLVTLVETLLRFISFEIKSEKMYKASLWLA